MEIHWPTARKYGVKKLYHYQQFKRKWLKRMLFDGEIYFSKPKEFNDSQDCRFSYKEVDSKEAFDLHVRWFANDWCRSHPELSEEEIARYVNHIQDNPAKLTSMLPLVAGILQKNVDNWLRIYCLTPKHDSSIMWDHYADKHKGICIGFHSYNNVFSGALRVDYKEEHPALDITDDSSSASTPAVLTKSLDWSCENEYRLLAQEHSEAIPYDDLTTDDGYWKLPPDSLMSIHLGCEMPDKTIKHIVAMVVKSKFRPRIYRMKPGSNRDELMEEEIIYEGNTVSNQLTRGSAGSRKEGLGSGLVF